MRDIGKSLIRVGTTKIVEAVDGLKSSNGKLQKSYFCFSVGGLTRFSASRSVCLRKANGETRREHVSACCKQVHAKTVGEACVPVALAFA